MLNQMMTSMYPMRTPMQISIKNKHAEKLVGCSMAMPMGFIIDMFVKEIISMLKGKKHLNNTIKSNL